MGFFSNLDYSQFKDLLTYNPSEPLIFSSGFFLLLFILFLVPYMFLLKRTKLRIIYVAVFSLYFYYKCSAWYVFLLLFAASSDFLIAHQLYISQSLLDRKKWLLISLLINLSVLAYFKYFNMLMDLFTWLLSHFGLFLGQSTWREMRWEAWDIILPVGISFYTFQTMSYILDVYRGEIKPLQRWIDYVFYVSFFPQLVAGPIVRAKEFIPQIYRNPFLGRREYSEALILILSGLIKKAIISDYISLNFVDRVFDAPSLYTGFENLMGVYGYALQIYCDFSGYSDMAIGIALILGFRFNINFNSPYQSASITEFWRRWHISLSSWLRDYLYISMGGNRKGQLRTYLHLFITMLIGGLWHGANWRFVLWGMMHGLALAVHKLWSTIFPSSSLSADQLPLWRRYLGRIVTFHLVCLSWVLFRADTIDQAIEVINQIRFNFHPEVIWQFIVGYKMVVFLMLIGYIAHFISQARINTLQRRLLALPFWGQTLLLVLVIFILIQMRSTEIQPFIYFQF